MTSPTTLPFSRRTAFVTGAGSGIGAETAVLLAERGAHVALVGRDATRLEGVRDRIVHAGGTALVLVCDVSDPDALAAAVEVAHAKWGGPHLLVNNAGVTGIFKPTDQLTPEEWRSVTSVDLDAIFFGVKFVVPHMIAAGGGAIVNVSSVFADRGGPTADYSSSKHAIRGLTRSLAIEYAQRGIRVNELQPGVIDTDMTRANPEGTAAVANSGIPMRRVGDPREVAYAIAFLLSEEASYITGAHLAVDGGFLA